MLYAVLLSHKGGFDLDKYDMKYNICFLSTETKREMTRVVKCFKKLLKVKHWLFRSFLYFQLCSVETQTLADFSIHPFEVFYSGSAFNTL